MPVVEVCLDGYTNEFCEIFLSIKLIAKIGKKKLHINFIDTSTTLDQFLPLARIRRKSSLGML